MRVQLIATTSKKKKKKKKEKKTTLSTTIYCDIKDQVLLRCVDAVEAKKILEEIHEGVYGAHANSFTMAKQIMRFGQY
ncbi:RNA-directed DNA polymerase [Gossypium australe]|uniref:RNA-directed DNA polymerase n=1 Tax=Gossypium australe TaxID=47621 RepID=A0A5B6WPZ1_9ROSI|nr:RNA-directed DNA polymerase [Gossypium australe]